MQALRDKQRQSGAGNVIDAKGRPIMPGCDVLFQPQNLLEFRVLDIKSVLDHRAPAGTVVIVLQTTQQVIVRAALPVTNMWITGYPSAVEEEAQQAAEGSADREEERPPVEEGPQIPVVQVAEQTQEPPVVAEPAPGPRLVVDPDPRD